MTEQEEHLLRLQIEEEIYTAFKDVKLEDGIGYWESDAIDDFHKKDSLEYSIAKAKDERDDWTKLITFFENKDINYAAWCFMDAKGLYFYLPFLMINTSTNVTDIIAPVLIDLKHPEENTNLNLSFLLTKEQKRCILHFYQFNIAIDEPWWRKEDLEENYTWKSLQEQKKVSYNFMKLMEELF